MDRPDSSAPAPMPVQVPLATRPLGVWDSLRTGRRNLLELIPEIATRQPMVSGRTVKRWHMVMDPGRAAASSRTGWRIIRSRT